MGPSKRSDRGSTLSNLIRHEPKRNMRVRLSDGSNDLEIGPNGDPRLYLAGSWPLNNIMLANAVKSSGYDFHFRFGEGYHGGGQAGLDLPESLAWLWRDYDADRTEQTYEQDPANVNNPYSGSVSPTETRERSLLRIRRIVAQTDVTDASATSLEQELLLGGAKGRQLDRVIVRQRHPQPFDVLASKTVVHFARQGITSISAGGLAFLGNRTTDMSVAETLSGVEISSAHVQNARVISTDFLT